MVTKPMVEAAAAKLTYWGYEVPLSVVEQALVDALAAAPENGAQT